jgi:aspartyl-tRNA(Asn)/glutamyl-tRNA(Gln) amidotransferase subunit C
MLSEKEIEKIAQLARIELTAEEKKLLQKELSKILDFFGQLDKVDIKNVDPLYQTTGLLNSFRTDENRGDFRPSDELTARLVGQAPHKKDNFVKVKSVLKK